jgi:vancomycin resistance protein VanJ
MGSNQNHSLAGKLIILCLWIFGGAMLLWNVLRIWPGEQFWPVAMVNYFAPWFALMLVPMVLLAWLLKERFLSGFLLLALVLIAIRFIPYFTPSAISSSTENQIKIMSFNVFQRNNDVQGIIDIILEHEPDIVALQEVTPDVGDQLSNALSPRYPYHTLDLLGNMMGQGLLSKYPIRQMSDLPDYNFQSATIDTPEGSIQVFNIHSPTLIPFTWKEDWQIQRTFFDDVVADIEKVEGPIIVLGDFNTTPLSELYALLTENLTDTHIASGWGFGFSYPARPKLGIRFPTPLLRIDYIFTNEFFSSFDTQVLKESGDSDHRPVLTHLVLNG